MNTIQRNRRIVQVIALLVLSAIPLLGIFRIDMEKLTITLFNHQLWFSDVIFIYMLYGMVVPLLVTCYLFLGRVVCSWGCPQTIITEYLDKIDGFRFLILNAQHFELPEKERKRLQKLNTPVVTEGLRILSGTISLFLALYLSFLFCSFFSSPESIIQNLRTLFLLPFQYMGIAEGTPSVIALGEMANIKWFFVLLLLLSLDFLYMRRRWCKVFCPYGIWQTLFTNSNALRVKFAENREDECIQCERCVKICFMDIDPRNARDMNMDCVNCGDCIDECERVFAKSEHDKLLSFTLGKDKTTERDAPPQKFLARFPFYLFIPPVVFLFFATSFVINMLEYQPVYANIVLLIRVKGNTYTDKLPFKNFELFQVAVVNKAHAKDRFHLSIEGLPKESYIFEENDFPLEAGERRELDLYISPEFFTGTLHLNRFRLGVQSLSDERVKISRNAVIISTRKQKKPETEEL